MNKRKIQPIQLNKRTAYLSGAIIGDGNISNYSKSKNDLSKDYRIYIEGTDRRYMELLLTFLSQTVSTNSKLTHRKSRLGKKPSWYIQVRNKSLYYFLTDDLKIPSGKKCYCVKIPPRILDSNADIQKSFIAGFFDTDGGFRSGGLGITSASKELIVGVGSLLKKLKISSTFDSWIHHTYGKRYYGIRIKSSETDTFLNKIPLQNIEKLARIRAKFHAEVPEWPNGTDTSTILVR